MHKAVPAEHICPEQRKSVGSRGLRIVTRPPCFPPSAATQRPCMGKKEADDGPPARRGLCGYELLYTKQLNQEQLVGPRRRRLGGGAWRQAGKIRCSFRERLQRMWLQTNDQSHKLFAIDLYTFHSGWLFADMPLKTMKPLKKHSEETQAEVQFPVTQLVNFQNTNAPPVSAVQYSAVVQIHTVPSKRLLSPLPTSILAELSL